MYKSLQMMCFFKRFITFKEDSWNGNRDRWDAIAFIPNRTIQVTGMGIYELFPLGGAFSFKWKYQLEDENGALIHASEDYEE